VESENFERWLSVRVVRRLVLEVMHADFLKERGHHTKQIRQPNIFIDDQALNLMELGQVSSVKSLIAENSVNREVLHGFEFASLLAFLSQFVKHLRGDSSSVSTQDVLLRLFKRPAFTISE